MHALVADDNPVCRDVAAAQLSLLGFRVTTATDGDDALAAIGKHGRFDLILVDWAMGPKDGHELIRNVRALPGNITTCICLWTGDPSQERRDAAIHSGANAVLPKPFALRELALHLAQLGFRS